MRYTRISADCHVDLCWLPPDLFTSSASAAMKDRMPYVTDGPSGPRWVTKKGANLGLMNGMGSAGREYVAGRIHRSDRMASTGLYEDGKRGIRRLTDPELRLKDQERDGVQAEILYGILGATRRLNDAEAAVELVRIYNEWLAGFCDTHPDRYAGLACIPNSPVEAAVEEMRRVIKRGSVRGLEIAHSYDIAPLWDPQWNPVWEVANEAALPVHFHTVGERRPDLAKLPPQLARVEHAVHISGFQLYMATTLISVIFAGVLERYRNVKIVIGESGIGWIPYVLDRMDAEWEDQFKDLASPCDRVSTGVASAGRPTRVIASASNFSTTSGTIPSCGARTSPTQTVSGPTRASSSSASWATYPQSYGIKSSARTPASCTGSYRGEQERSSRFQVQCSKLKAGTGR